MGHGGDKFRLHFLRLTDLVGHIVDGVRQLADLIVGVELYLYAVAAGSDPFGGLGDLGNRA